jgi:hypothetical protein
VHCGRVDDGTHPKASLEWGPAAVPPVPKSYTLDSLTPLGTFLSHESGTPLASSRIPGRRTPERARLAAVRSATKLSTQGIPATAMLIQRQMFYYMYLMHQRLIYCTRF